MWCSSTFPQTHVLVGTSSVFFFVEGEQTHRRKKESVGDTELKQVDVCRCLGSWTHPAEQKRTHRKQHNHDNNKRGARDTDSWLSADRRANDNVHPMSMNTSHHPISKTIWCLTQNRVGAKHTNFETGVRNPLSNYRLLLKANVSAGDKDPDNRRLLSGRSPEIFPVQRVPHDVVASKISTSRYGWKTERCRRIARPSPQTTAEMPEGGLRPLRVLHDHCWRTSRFPSTSSSLIRLAFSCSSSNQLGLSLEFWSAGMVHVFQPTELPLQAEVSSVTRLWNCQVAATHPSRPAGPRLLRVCQKNIKGNVNQASCAPPCKKKVFICSFRKLLAQMRWTCSPNEPSCEKHWCAPVSCPSGPFAQVSLPCCRQCTCHKLRERKQHSQKTPPHFCLANSVGSKCLPPPRSWRGWSWWCASDCKKSLLKHRGAKQEWRNPEDTICLEIHSNDFGRFWNYLADSNLNVVVVETISK